MRRMGRAAVIAVALATTAGCSTLGIGPDGPYPDDEVTFIVPYGPGGSTDPISRQFVEQLETTLGTSVVVENREGGSATIGTSRVVNAYEDGYTIGLSSNSALAYQSQQTDALPYSTPDDYQALVKLADLPTVLAVPADAPWDTFEEFMDEARERPGELRVAVSGARTAPDLSVQQLNRVADVELTTVPFTGGGGESLTALLSGEVEATAGYAPTIKAQVDAGELRALAVFHDDEYPTFPDADGVVESGYEVTLPAAYYVIAPAGLPPAVRDQLLESSREAVATPEFEEFATGEGYALETLDVAEINQELRDYQREYRELDDFLGW